MIGKSILPVFKMYLSLIIRTYSYLVQKAASAENGSYCDVLRSSSSFVDDLASVGVVASDAFVVDSFDSHWFGCSSAGSYSSFVGSYNSFDSCDLESCFLRDLFETCYSFVGESFHLIHPNPFPLTTIDWGQCYRLFRNAFVD